MATPLVRHAIAPQERFEIETTIPEQWDHFVQEHPQGTVYHSSPWLRLICETYRYRLLFILRRQGEEIQAGMPLALVDSWLTGRRLVAFPFSDYCQPLTSSPETSEALFGVADEERCRRRAAFLEIRGFQAPMPSSERPLYLNHQLSLEKSTGDLWSGLHHDCVRRQIQKARRQGVACETANPSKPADARDFYRLHSLTRRRQGVPIQPNRFFRSLLSSMADSGLLELHFARYCGQRVASILVLYFADVAYFKFGACNVCFNSTGANQLLMWQAIQSAQVRGVRIFDFGRTSVANRGLRDYKRRWGATERPLHYLVSPAGRRPLSLVETSRRHKLIKDALRHMPVWANRLAGECFYRHLA